MVQVRPPPLSRPLQKFCPPSPPASEFEAGFQPSPGVIRKPVVQGGMRWFAVSLTMIHLPADPSHRHFSRRPCHIESWSPRTRGNSPKRERSSEPHHSCPKNPDALCDKNSRVMLTPKKDMPERRSGRAWRNFRPREANVSSSLLLAAIHLGRVFMCKSAGPLIKFFGRTEYIVIHRCELHSSMEHIYTGQRRM